MKTTLRVFRSHINVIWRYERPGHSLADSNQVKTTTQGTFIFFLPFPSSLRKESGAACVLRRRANVCSLDSVEAGGSPCLPQLINPRVEASFPPPTCSPPSTLPQPPLTHLSLYSPNTTTHSSTKSFIHCIKLFTHSKQSFVHSTLSCCRVTFSHTLFTSLRVCVFFLIHTQHSEPREDWRRTHYTINISPCKCNVPGDTREHVAERKKL